MPRRHLLLFRWPLKLLALLLCCLPAACSQDGQSDHLNLQTIQQPGSALLPAFPPPHSSSGIVQHWVYAADYLQRSSGASLTGEGMLLSSGPQASCWALYALAASPAPQSLDVDLTSDSAACWIALADFSQQRWQLSGPWAADPQLALNTAQHRSPEGLVYAAVLSYDSAAATLVKLTLSGYNELPLPALEADQLSGEVPLSVNFDASASSDSDGSIERFDYDLDASGGFERQDAGMQVQKTYSVPGIYDVRLKVTDDQGESAIATLSISANANDNALPVAALSADAPGGQVPVSISFDAGASLDPDGSIISYDYDFDGDMNFDALDAGPSAEHNYNQPGVFEARVRVTDNEGAQDDATVTVTVSNEAPDAQLSPESVSGNAPQDVDFDASASTPGTESGDSIALYEWDFNGDGTYEQSGSSASVTHSYTGGISGNAVVRVSDSYGASATASCSLDINGAPQAVLVLSSDSVLPDETLSLDASASSDPDGSIVKYEWDSDGNGSFETDSGTDSIIETSVAEGGSHNLMVRVTDDDGATKTASALLFVQIWVNWNSPQGDEDDGSSSSMALVAGKPAIAYMEESNSILRYVRAVDEYGDAWTEPLTLDAGGPGINQTGIRPKLELVGMHPAVAYEVLYSSSETRLGYVRATDTTGESWESPVTVSSSVAVFEPSLAVINGRPAISYKDKDASHLHYVRANDATGDSWGSYIAVDADGTVRGASSCLLEINGRPAISYERTQRLGYVRALDSDGASWPDGQILDATTTSARNGTDMLIMNGVPVIAYERISHLYFIKAIDADGSLWEAPVKVVDRGSRIFVWPDLAIVDNRPAIAFHDNKTDLDLYYVLAQDSGGTQWNQELLIDSGPDQAGFWPTLAVVAGHPAIAYTGYDTVSQLRYKRASNSTGY
ncbi:PKD domain-containing protein [bacterium]|nr:PKD domain-containing protein [bacterium]